VGHRDQVLAPGFRPPHRPADPGGGPGDGDRVPVGADLGSEPAADVRRDHPDRGAVEAQPPGQRRAGDLRVLRARPHREPPVCPGRGRPAGLDRDRRDPLVHDHGLDHGITAVEQRVARVIRVAIGGHQVGAGRGEQQGPAGQRVVEADHRVQRVVIHADQLGRILALVPPVGDDHRDRLTDEPHPVGGQQRLGHRFVPLARQPGRVLGGQHRDHSGLGERGGGVDPGDERVRARAAHERDPRRPGQLGHLHVVHVGAAHREQPLVLDPQYPPA
jgi:hypothetical protein